MEKSFFVGLLQNIALLLTFSMIYDYFWARRKTNQILFFKIASGVLLGVLGVVLILTPWTYIDGIIFDTRSVILCISGLFLGAIPTIIAIIITAAYRIMLGGSGALMGVMVIISSGTIGLLWRYFRPHWRKKNPVLELLGMGMVVHICMLAWLIFLPPELRFQTFKTIVFSVLFLYPAATLLLGLLMMHQAQNSENKKALDKSEQRWHFAIEGAGDGLWDWNPQTNEIFYSKQWKKMLGYNEDEIENSIDEWKKLLHPDETEKIYAQLSKFQSGEISDYEMEQRMLCKNGTYKWILDRGKVMSWDKSGKPWRCIGTHTDITERKKTEQALKESEQYTNSILSAIPDYIFIMDANGLYLDFKSGNADDLILPQEILINKNIVDVLPKKIAVRIQKGIDFVLKNKKSHQIEYELKLNTGINSFECTILPFGESKVIKLVRNITKQKQVEETLRNSKEQLKNFAAHLQNVREEERVLLAREIHDELGQILVAIKIDLGMLKQQTSGKLNKDATEEIINQFQQLSQMVDNTLKAARRIMTDLRPEVLDMLGLVEAIKLHVNNFQERHNISCSFENEITQLNIDLQCSVALFRIVQESLTNIVKHANASEVRISLRNVDNKLIMEVSDNGVGFDLHTKVREDSYGLIGMKERVYLLDGEFSVLSKQGKGTTVKVEMPYSQSEPVSKG